MTKSNQPFAEEGYELMGTAFEVHNVQGGGLLEEIGCLINFGPIGKLEYKRFILSEFV